MNGDIPVDTNIPTQNTDIAVGPLVDANNNDPQERAGVHTGSRIQPAQKRLTGESYFNTISNEIAIKKMGP